MGMTNKEATHKLEYSKKAYQMLIDEKVDSGKFVGKDVEGEWKADTPLDEAYKSMIEALDLAIKALEQQSSDDCISREEAIRVAEQGQIQGYEWQFKKLCTLPSVTPTRPKGKWIILDECANEGVYCSKCHKTVFKLEFSHTMKWRNFKYCPNCGADMRGEEE